MDAYIPYEQRERAAVQKAAQAEAERREAEQLLHDAWTRFKEGRGREPDIWLEVVVDATDEMRRAGMKIITVKDRRHGIARDYVIVEVIAAHRIPEAFPKYAPAGTLPYYVTCGLARDGRYWDLDECLNAAPPNIYMVLGSSSKTVHLWPRGSIEDKITDAIREIVAYEEG